MTHGPHLSAADKSFVDGLALRALAIVLGGWAATGMTDTDIWGHTAIGLDMLSGRRFLWVDPYSFTHDQRWVNHEWLWDVATAALYRSTGLPGLLFLRMVLVAAVLRGVHRATLAAPAAVRAGTLVLVTLGCIGQWQSTRPQIATMALYAVLLSNLQAQWLPALFVLWANVHGGWLFGWGTLMARAVVKRSRSGLVLGLLCAAATLVNPYGVGLWAALADALQRGWGEVSEWAPVWNAEAGLAPLFLLVLFLTALALVWQRVRHDPFAWAWTLLAFAAAARSRRLMGLASITAAMLLLGSWRGAPALGLPRTPTSTRRRLLSAGATAVAAAAAFVMVRPSLECFPPIAGLTAPEPGAVEFMRGAGARRVVVHFDIGEYVIFHLRDRLQVSIDNRRETVYSARAVQAAQRFSAGDDPEYPDRLGADAIWWPREREGVLPALERRGWVRRFEGPRSVVLLRQRGPLVTGTATAATPCFPRP